jgi:hypothetical protein
MDRGDQMDQLDDFEEWLLAYGSAPSTVELYVQDVRRAYALGGPLERLLDDELAPKTRWHILAACRASSSSCQQTSV